MSIEFSSALDRFSSQTSIVPSRTSVAGTTPRVQRSPSPRRREANRRNALKSTGPRTPEGKRRASRNALKHGLCAATAIPACEDGPTFSMHCDELFKELNPATIVQKVLFQQIAQLIWNLRRLPQAQAAMFQLELDKEPDAGTLSVPELLAQRFSNAPSNGFALLGRYERANQAMLLRLLNQFHKLQKQTQSAKPDPDQRVPREYVPATTPTQLAMQELRFNRRREERALHVPARNAEEINIDRCDQVCAEQKKQSQPKRAENAIPSAPAAKSADKTNAPVTKRTQSLDKSTLASSPRPRINGSAVDPTSVPLPRSGRTEGSGEVSALNEDSK